MKLRKYALDFICGLLMILFIYAGAIKLMNFKAARHDMFNQPFPTWLKQFLLYALPPTEIVIGLLMIPRKTQRAAIIAFIALMLAFDLYTILILAHVFPYVPCGCGGVIRNLNWPQHLIFNSFFTILGILALVLHYKRRRLLAIES